ncbi:MAG: hypothetical protein ABSF69_27645, partial [Polyangiaceae bacterium]
MRAKVPAWTWRIYPLGRRDGWTLKYWDQDSARREHAIPARYRTESDANEYAAAWIAERMKVTSEERTAKADPPVPGPLGITFRQFAEQWTSGQLNDRYPDHVGMKRTSDD